MSYTFRLPTLNATTPEGQLQQMKAYMFQMTRQLEWALSTIEAGTGLESGSSSTETPGGAANETELEDPVSLFGRVKGLIIKSADIVNAYYDKMINTFEGKYFAESDFGTYLETTKQTLEYTSTGVGQYYESEEQIKGAIESYKNITAYIKTGKLYEDADGTAVYGMEIGQQVEEDGVQTYKKFTRLTSERLSFFDRYGNEVAYISDRKMYIASGEMEYLVVKSNLTVNRIQLGDYLLVAGDDGHLTLQ